jgi:hypothetical protein
VRDERFARREASTNGFLDVKSRGWPKKSSGSYVEVHKEPDVLLTIK